MRRLVLGVFAASLLVTESPVLAQDAQPEPEDDDGAAGSNDDAETRARKLYREGDAHYAAGRYEEAVVAFAGAYELSPKPLLQYNLANAYERIGDYQSAAAALRRYLESPEASDVVSIRERVRRLDASAEAERKRQEELARAKEESDKREQADDRPRAVPIQPPARDSNAASSTDRGSDGGPSRTAPLIFTGVAAAGLGVGVASALISRSARTDAEAVCADDRVCVRTAESELDRHRRFALIADIGFGVAIASAGVAAYLFLRSGSSAKPDGDLAVNVAGSRSSFGIEVSGAF